MDSFDKECPRCHGEGLAATNEPIAPTINTPAPVVVPVPKEAINQKSLYTCLGLGCGVPVLAWLLIVMLAAMVGKTDASNSLGYQYAKAEITRKLKAPTTAKFPASYERGVIMQEVDGELHIAGFVDAQNSFGAMIRSRWSARLKRTPDRKSWEVIEASLAE